MTHAIDSGKTQLGLQSILTMGALRTVVVSSCLYPLEVVKTRQQASATVQNSGSIALNLLRSEGIYSLYKGFAPNLLKGVIRQAVCWPGIAYIPPFLKEHGITGASEYAITGFSVGALDALMTYSLEKQRVLASIGSSKSEIITEKGWKSGLSYWRRQGMVWSLLLLGKHHLAKPDAQEKFLSAGQIINAACKMSLVASLIMTPLDVMNTLSMSGRQGQMKISEVRWFNVGQLKILYRGFPLIFFSMFMQTSATLLLMDRIEGKR